MSAHRGLPTAKLFTDLDRLEIGDTFQIRVLDQVLTYQVDQIKVVRPTEIDDVQIVEEKEAPGLLSEDLQLLLLQQLLIHIHRQLPNPMPEVSDESFDMVHKIQKQFEQSYAENVTLAQVAREYGLSASYLSHIFKKVTGHSLMGYLQSCRMAAAKKYLAGTSKSIGEIVEMIEA